jgi:hypothetical protein
MEGDAGWLENGRYTITLQGGKAAEWQAALLLVTLQLCNSLPER